MTLLSFKDIVSTEPIHSRNVTDHLTVHVLVNVGSVFKILSVIFFFKIMIYCLPFHWEFGSCRVLGSNFSVTEVKKGNKMAKY